MELLSFTCILTLVDDFLEKDFAFNFYYTDYLSASSNDTLPWSEGHSLAQAFVMRVELVVANDPLFDVCVPESGPFPMLACEVCDSHVAFVL